MGKTCCSICGHIQCGLMVRVDDGAVKEIVADRRDPVSDGAVCPKGLGSIQLLQHPARLKSPLIRVGERARKMEEGFLGRSGNPGGETARCYQERIRAINRGHG